LAKFGKTVGIFTYILSDKAQALKRRGTGG
jgi:hypothetical protein